MPRVIIVPGMLLRRVEQLTSKLAHELAEPGEGPLPLIIERQMPRAGFRHVYVLWDEWDDLDDEERSRVILAAYGKNEGEESLRKITVALGMKPEEALIYGLLPFKVQPSRRGDADKEEYRKAIAEEAARTPLKDPSAGLHYPRIEEAVAAQKRLMKAMPRSSWLVIKEADEE